MVMYCQELRKLENNFNDLEYLYILQEKNEITDELAKLSSNRATVPLRVFIQELHEPSISKALAKPSPEVMEIHSDWRTPFMIYLKTEDLLEDKDECE
jgi:hypothetical protein